MKIAILGGGGFRVPMVYGALLARAERLGLEQVSLYDVDELRLAQIAPVLEGLEREPGSRLGFTPTTQLDDALDGADFVFCAIRVGKLEGRVVDERVPLDEGVVGQETTGPGGLCFALRTVPVMVELARARRRARTAGVVRQLHEPGGARDRGDPRTSSATARSASATRRRGSAAASPRRSTAIRTSSGSTTSGSTTSAGCAACTTATRDLLPGLLARRRPARDRSRKAVSSAASGCARSG